ncbi:hypothetical protein ECG_02309 [Echinococcus granulosus]|nr:hypothetical protein ECG_02309 [Echinococcus granulosus]
MFCFFLHTRLSRIQVGVQAAHSHVDPSSEAPPKENCLLSVGRLTPFARIGTPSLPSPSTWVENDSTPPTLHFRPELMRQLSPPLDPWTSAQRPSLLLAMVAEWDLSTSP